MGARCELGIESAEFSELSMEAAPFYRVCPPSDDSLVEIHP